MLCGVSCTKLGLRQKYVKCKFFVHVLRRCLEFVRHVFMFGLCYVCVCVCVSVLIGFMLSVGLGLRLGLGIGLGLSLGLGLGLLCTCGRVFVHVYMYVSMKQFAYTHLYVFIRQCCCIAELETFLHDTSAVAEISGGRRLAPASCLAISRNFASALASLVT